MQCTILKMYYFSFITGDIGHSDGCHTADVYCPGERKNKQKPTQVLHASDTIYRAKLTTQQILKEARSPLLRNGDLIMINTQCPIAAITHSFHQCFLFLYFQVKTYFSYVNLIMIRLLFRGNMEAN